MALSGWYPDPWGDYEHRYWDGQQWTDHVASYGHQTQDPLVEPVLPDHEQVLWQADGNQLSTHRAWVKDGTTKAGYREVALWTVAEVQLTANAGQARRGAGRLALHVSYPGYAGRSHYVMVDVPNAGEVAALARKWVNRCRRAAGGQLGA